VTSCARRRRTCASTKLKEAVEEAVEDVQPIFGKRIGTYLSVLHCIVFMLAYPWCRCMLKCSYYLHLEMDDSPFSNHFNFLYLHYLPAFTYCHYRTDSRACRCL
jgi:hypothetical protein